MKDSRRRILKMVSQGKITVDEAERLLAAIGEPTDAEARPTEVVQGRKADLRFLRVVIEPTEGPEAKQEHVNIRVPVSLLRAGMRFASFIPASAADEVNRRLIGQGIDLDVRNIKMEDLEKLVDAMRDFELDVKNPQGNVRIYFE